MVGVFDLWLPILLSGVFVFVVSSVVHMVLPIHKKDFSKLAGEEKVMAAMRENGVKPGYYMLPWAGSMKEMGSPEMIERMNRGPVGTLVVRPNGPIQMGSALGQWFVFCLVVGLLTAYVGSLGLTVGADGTSVFRLTSAAALMGHAIGVVNESIWKGVPWSVSARYAFDGLLYALTTAATFAWLWPAA